MDSTWTPHEVYMDYRVHIGASGVPDDPQNELHIFHIDSMWTWDFMAVTPDRLQIKSMWGPSEVHVGVWLSVKCSLNSCSFNTNTTLKCYMNDWRIPELLSQLAAGSEFMSRIIAPEVSFFAPTK